MRVLSVSLGGEMQQKFLLTIGILTLALGGVVAILGGVGIAQEDNVVEIALIHNTTVGAGDDFPPPALFPGVVRVQLGQTVRLFNTSADPLDFLEVSPHDPVFIATDEAGTDPTFTLTTVAGPESGADNGFRVDNGAVTVVEFVADQVGDFFITHRVHGHGVVGAFIVED
jgi:hypothetical protein